MIKMCTSVRLLIIFIQVFGLSFASIGLPGAVSAASFDCSKATTKTEVAICDDPILSALDDGMAKAFYSEDLVKSDELLASQRSWLAKRDACQNDNQCLTEIYFNRLREFKTILLSPQNELDVSAAEASLLKLSYRKLSKKNRLKIQKTLMNLGYYTSSIDGMYGPSTAAALIEYN